MSPQMNSDPAVVAAVEESLERLGAGTPFFDRFYDIFLSSSPKVKEKFAHTNFYKQKKALQASLYGMLRHLRDVDAGADEFLLEVADRHNHEHLAISADLYELWL